MKLKLHLIIISLVFLLLSCRDNPTSPDTPEKVPHLDSISPLPLRLYQDIRISGINFTEVKNYFAIYLENMKVDTSTITFWNDSLIIFHLTEKDNITKSIGKLYLRLYTFKSNKINYYFVKTPVIYDRYPIEAYLGDTITFRGKNFGHYTDSSRIIINNNKSNVVYPIKWEDEIIQFINPVPSSGDDVYFHALPYIGNFPMPLKGGANSGFSAIVPPIIHSLSSNVSAVGKSISINGEFFGNTKDSLRVFLNQTEIKTFTYLNESRINITFPQNSQSGELSVFRRYRSSNAISIKIINSPVINQLVKDNGSPGDIVEILGQDFGKVESNCKVYFDDKIAEILNFEENKISVKVPDITNHSYVRIEIEGIMSNDLLFKIPNGISLAEELEYIAFFVFGKENGLDVEMFSDTLKHVKNENYDYYAMNYQPINQSEPITAAIFFDKQTFSIDKLSFNFHYFSVNSSQISSLTRRGVRMQVYSRLPISIKSADSLIYIFDKSKGTFFGYDEQVHWEDYRHGGSGDYRESGTYPLETLPGYTLVFKKLK